MEDKGVIVSKEGFEKLEKELDYLRTTKRAEIAEKMVQGRIQKFYKEICLAEQPFIKDGDVSVAKYVANNGGEILKMVRYEVGEGMEKRNDNFAEEVMNQVKGN